MEITSRHYWKSLSRLHDSPAIPEELTQEFPEHAQLPPHGLLRRRVLELMGASFGLAGLVSCRRPEETIVPFVEAPEGYVPGVAKRFASTMPLGTSAFGVVVESHEGRPTKIEGNELHPASRGAASAWMQAALLDLYDPDRSVSVLHRGSDQGLEESSWDAAVEEWQSIAGSLESNGGRGLAVVSESYASPAYAKLAGAFRERFARAQWVVYEALGEENVLRGSELVTGRRLRPVYRFERARRVLALDADFLHTEADTLGYPRDFARSRKTAADRSRLYVVESGLSTTGANADYRIALASHRIPLVLLHIASALGLYASDLPALPESVAMIANELADARGQALVVVGKRQPPEVHAAALAINEHLGAFGATLSLLEPSDSECGSSAALSSLAESMRRREVDTLVMLGGNPVYDAPGDVEFGEALTNVERSFHLASHIDETSRQVRWHLPRTHFLESWLDARAVDGTPSIVQPLIAPLYDGRSTLEVLSLLVFDELRDGFGLVRDAWIPGVLGDDDVESKWNRALHDGVHASSEATASITITVNEDVSFAPLRGINVSSRQRVELVFSLSPTVYDGRFANNGWLQELPDAVTKLTWDNAALVSPSTAERLGVATSDLISIATSHGELTAPVLVVPGRADDSIGLNLGYGRSAAGRVGNGVGVDVHRLRRAATPFLETDVEVSKLDGSHALAVTQEHWSMEGRDLVRESAPERDNGHSFVASLGHSEPASLFAPPPLEGERQWGMVIDLDACQGCNACITACQSENNIPVVGKEQVLLGREMQWLRVDRYFVGKPDNPEVVFQPVPCMHCENAPCEQVCPVGATVHDSEGLNAMVYNRCIGTRYCSNNCAYKVRRFNFFNYTKDVPEVTAMAMNPDVTVRSRGVMEKCTYCVQRLHESEEHALQTACQQTCPAQAITFGNIADPESRVAKLKASDRNYVLLEELDNRPRTSYLTKIASAGLGDRL